MNSNERSILIVDDDEALRSGLLKLFELKGFRAKGAESAREALAKIHANNFDLIISDVRMPDGDGVYLLEETKKLNVKLPVFMFITGFTDLPIDVAYAMGAEAVFSKPFKTSQLISAVETALLPVSSKWRTEVMDDSERFSIALDGLSEAHEQKQLQLGRGGMFVATSQTNWKAGDSIAFEILITRGDVREISGRGTVRWSRRAKTEDLTPGIGVEFKFLSDECRSQIIQLTDKDSVAFIPRGE